MTFPFATHTPNPTPQSVMGINAPAFWRPGGSIETALAPGATGAAVKYRWLRPLVIVDWIVITSSGANADLAAMSFTWEDGYGDQIVTSGFAANNSLPCFGMVGASSPHYSRWTPCEIEVMPQHVHTFTFTNGHASNTITPILLFHCVERATL